MKIYKASKKKNKDKALILSEEDAEQLLNDGWKTTPSALPLERQMDAMYIMQMEYDSKLFPAYVMVEANSVNQDYNAAKKRAVELAKSVLVEKIQSEISLQIDWAIKTELIESKEGEALIKSLKAAKNSISQNLEEVMIVEDSYRITSSKRFEVRVTIACTADVAKKALKDAVNADLEQNSEKLQITPLQTASRVLYYILFAGH